MSITNEVYGRTFGVNNVKRIGNVCYFHVFFNRANINIPTGKIITFPVKADGRADFYGYAADEGSANYGIRFLYMLDNSNELTLADVAVGSGYFLAVSGSFVCKD